MKTVSSVPHAQMCLLLTFHVLLLPGLETFQKPYPSFKRKLELSMFFN